LESSPAGFLFTGYWEFQEVTSQSDEDGEVTEELLVTSITTADILAAIEYAANELGVDAMNMSIWTPPLVAATNPELNAEQIESVIERGTKRATDQQKDDLGAGALDAAGAVGKASGRRNGNGNGN
jgi:hypothetical protein